MAHVLQGEVQATQFSEPKLLSVAIDVKPEEQARAKVALEHLAVPFGQIVQVVGLAK